MNGLDVNREQAAVIQDTIAPLRGDLEKLTDAGMDYSTAAEVNNTLDNLGEDASSTEEYMAIAQMPISESEKNSPLKQS